MKKLQGKCKTQQDKKAMIMTKLMEFTTILIGIRFRAKDKNCLIMAL